MHTHVATSMQDPNGSLLSSQAVPERLRGLVPHTAGDQNELQNVPGSFKLPGVLSLHGTPNLQCLFLRPSDLAEACLPHAATERLDYGSFAKLDRDIGAQNRFC